jgi:hypothetical protein
LPLVAVVVEDAAVGLVRAWAEGDKATRAEVWGRVPRAFKAELWAEEAEASKAKDWDHAAKALKADVWAEEPEVSKVKAWGAEV